MCTGRPRWLPASFLSLLLAAGAGFTVLPVGIATAAAAGALEVTALTVNGRADEPIGLDTSNLHFSWHSSAATQSAYQVRVATSAAALESPDLWDSGRVESDRSTDVSYGGPALDARERVFWQARVWDGAGTVSAWSAPSTWEMGLLRQSDWGKAQWIEHPTRSRTDALPLFARTFDSQAQVTKARLYIAGLGIVVPTLNGKPVTDAMLAPGQGNLQRSIETGSYDVTRLVRDGANTLAVALGNGPTNVVNVPNPAVGRTSVYTKFQSTAPITTSLAAPAEAGSDTLKVASTAGLVPGATLHVDTGDAGVRVESHRIVSVGTAGAAGTGVVLDSALGGAHATGAAVRSSGSGPEDAGRATTPRFIARLEIDYAGGGSQTVVSDASWRTALGPYVTDHWYAGDDFDARREQPGWDMPGADLGAAATRRDGAPTGWVDAGISTAPSLDTKLVWRSAPPVRIVQTFTAKVSHPTATTWVFDMGQNFAGTVQVNVPGGALPAGTVIKLKPGEQLAASGNGTVDSASLGSGNGIFDTYTTSGDRDGESWASPFRYTGVQYVEVTGLPAGFTPTADFVRGLQTRADVAVSGDVTTSDDIVNRLHRMSQYSIMSNMQSVFTDCPNREKLGWLADLSQSLGAIDRNFDMPSFLPHISQVMSEAQLSGGPNAGMMPDIAPELTVFGGGFRDDINWGSTVVLIPWWLWKQHGDLSTAREHYDSMVSYLRFVQRVQAGTGADRNLVEGKLADWAAGDTRTPGLLTGTAGYYTMTTKLADLADALGHNADAAEFRALGKDIRNAFNARFFNPTLHRYTTTGASGTIATQAAQALALDAGLVPDDEYQNVLGALVQLIRDYHPFGGGPHVSGGMVSLGQIIRVLADNGRADLLWEMLHETTRPSWGFFTQPSVRHPDGLTTMPEFWDLSNSQNHMILLQIDEWFSSGLAGIRQADDSVGFRSLVIAPQIVGTAEHPLTSAKGSYQTPYGNVASSWSRPSPDGPVTLDVTVPAGTTAEVHVPLRTGETVRSVVTDAPVADGGKPVGSAAGVTKVRQGDGVAIVTVQPGSYRFTTDPAAGWVDSAKSSLTAFNDDLDGIAGAGEADETAVADLRDRADRTAGTLAGVDAAWLGADETAMTKSTLDTLRELALLRGAVERQRRSGKLGLDAAARLDDRVVKTERPLQTLAQQALHIKTTLSTDRASVEFGRSLQATVSLTNSDQEALTDVTLAVIPPDGWSADAPRTWNNVSRGAQVQHTARLTVGPNQGAGTTVLTAKAHFRVRGVDVEVPLTGSVEVTSPLTVVSTQVSPRVVDNGGTAVVTVGLRNVSDATTTQASAAAVGLPDGWTTTAPVPFTLNHGESTIVDVPVTATSTAARGGQVRVQVFAGTVLLAQADAQVFLRTADCDREPTGEACLPVGTRVLANFEGSTDGWTAGANTSTVAAVASFANGPGTPELGQQVLEATPPSGVPANAWRTVVYSPQQPTTLATTRKLSLSANGYGGVSGPFQIQVTVTGTSGDPVTQTVTITPDAWNHLSIDLTDWASEAISTITVSFRAGTSGGWGGRFQIDKVLLQ